jgi:hypothetical protein
VVGNLDVGLDLAAVDGDQVTGTVTLGSTRLAKTMKTFTGTLIFDTRICAQYPIGGSITVTVGDELRTISFTDSCDGSFQIEIPSATYYSLSLPMRNCDGTQPPEPRFVALVDEGDQLSVDPSTPAARGGRRHYGATGRVGPTEASIRLIQRSDPRGGNERWFGVYQGQHQEEPGSPVYYTGSIGYSVATEGCRSSYFNGRDDPDFNPGILRACEGPCWD